MASTLTCALRACCLAASLGLFGLPAGAVEMSAGTKNFTPPAGVPNYFGNEAEPFTGEHPAARRPGPSMVSGPSHRSGGAERFAVSRRVVLRHVVVRRVVHGHVVVRRVVKRRVVERRVAYQRVASRHEVHGRERMMRHAGHAVVRTRRVATVHRVAAHHFVAHRAAAHRAAVHHAVAHHVAAHRVVRHTASRHHPVRTARRRS
ncbi:MAG TPA: hypothetical protein VND87_03630 [Stellaceae bacterium]|nr:hypothetical protein [Stellaceae bacterium]